MKWRPFEYFGVFEAVECWLVCWLLWRRKRKLLYFCSPIGAGVLAFPQRL